MKKRIISIMLTVCMLLSAMPVAAVPAYAETVDRTGWTKITGSTAISEDGSYYLDSDVTGNITVEAGVAATLDLNGHVLSAPAAGGSVIENSGTLTVTDSDRSPVHYFKYEENGPWTRDAEASDGDTLDEINEETGTVKVSGGCITGGRKNEDGGTGAGIFNHSSAKLTLDGCTIVGNTAIKGGGVYLDAGSSATVNGTVFCGNKAASTDEEDGDGGALYLNSKTGTLPGPSLPPAEAELTGVFMTGNSATNGGAVYVNSFSGLLMNGCSLKGNFASALGGGICKPYSDDIDVKLVLLNTEITGNTAGTNGGGVCFCYASECFAAGTMITMADGSERKIEDIAEGNLVKTFDHETGAVSSARVYYTYHGETLAVPFTLTFDSGRSISIAGCHDLLEQETRKYVTVSESNAESFVGEFFYGEDEQWHKLLSVTKESTPCEYYSIYTAGQQNCFANGLLTVPDDADCMLNIYELDEKLKADEKRLAADIAEFGLFSFEEAGKLRNISREWYDAANVKYLNIAVGRGLLTYGEASTLFDSVGSAGTKETTLAVKEASAASFLTAVIDRISGLFVIPAYAEEFYGSNPTLDDFNGYKDVLTIGKGTKIIENTAGAEPEAENVYLGWNENTGNNRIALAGTDHEGILVGITTCTPPTKTVPVPFTKGDNVSKSDEACFFSDKEAYADRYNSGEECKYLELTVGFAIREGKCEHGSVSAGYAKSYYEGETVTVTATPDKWYALDKIKAYKTGDETDVIEVTDGKFTMPAEDVTISATFVRAIQPITITAGSASKTYDGTALAEDGYTYTKGILAEGDELTAVVEGTVTDAGTAANKISSYKVMRDKVDVTEEYDFTDTVDGILTVTKRAVTLTSGSASKTYDGTPLTADEVTVGGDGFVSGEGAEFTVTGSRTEAGTSKNTFRYQLKTGTRAENYLVTTVEGNLTVKPAGSFSVRFDAKGGSPEPEVQTLEKGGKAAKPADPKKTGYTFTGWHRDEDGKQLWNFDADTVSADLILYAGWEEKEIPEYDVFFAMNGHGEQVATQSVARKGKVERPEDPQEDGFIFLGWYKSAALQEAWDFLCDAVTETTTLFAKWKKGDCAVRFSAAGLPDLYLAEGETIELPGAEKEGFAFSGWADPEEEGGSLHKAGESYTVTGNVNFRAVFTRTRQIDGKNVAIGDLQRPVNTDGVRGETRAEQLIVLEIHKGRVAAEYEAEVSRGIRAGAIKEYLEENKDADELLFGINVRLTDVKADEDGTSSTTRLVYSVKPYVRALKNGVAVSDEREVENSAIGTKMKFCLPMPTNALKYAKVEHMETDGDTVKDTAYYEVLTAVNKEGVTEMYVEAEAGSFSDFVVTFTNTKPKEPEPAPDPKPGPLDSAEEEPQNWWKTTDAGWILKPGTEDWYYVENHTLKKGWHFDSEDGYWYYLDPSTGKMLTGWVKVKEAWYYLNPEKKQQTWYQKEDGKWHYDVLSVSRPYGSMYRNEAVPDGCLVDAAGAWIR